MTNANVERRARFCLRMGAAIACFLLAGCDGGLSTQEAIVRCDQERTSKATVTDESYQECLTCYEECGDDCKALDTSPETYTCED